MDLNKLTFSEDIFTFVVPARRGGFIAGVNYCLVHLDWDTKKVTKLQESDQKLMFTDGKCDPQGKVWAGRAQLLLGLHVFCFYYTLFKITMLIEETALRYKLYEELLIYHARNGRSNGSRP